LSPGPPVGGLVGAWRWPGQSPHHCGLRQTDLWDVSRTALLYRGPAHRPTAAAATPGPVRGAASGADLVGQCGGAAALSTEGWRRRDTLPGGPCLWSPTDQIWGPGEDPRAARRHRRRDEYRP